MTPIASDQRLLMRLSASLLLAGQIFHIAVTQLHVSGDANDHHHIFAKYAGDGMWLPVHLGQFFGMGVLLAGLIVLAFALEQQLSGAAKSMARLGAVAAAVTLALYGILQAVDGVALKHAVTAWAAASDVDRVARFASAESVRWLEWGLRSYQNFAMGLTLIVCAAAVRSTAPIPRPIAWLMAFASCTYFAQGWIAGSDGFTSGQSIAIVLAWAVSLAWMAWLAACTWHVSAQDLSSRTNGPARSAIAP